MSSFFHSMVDFADSFSDLVVDQSKWSQATFGSDSERGPMGALKHLEKEACECQEAVGTPELCEELADCLLLLLDASRRAGVKPMQLVEAAQEKMVKNKLRAWPNPNSEWEYGEAIYIDTEDCMGNPQKFWRVYATNKSWINSTVSGVGNSPNEALLLCRKNVADKINGPVEHKRQYLVEYSDEQSGLVRHGSYTVTASSEKEAKEKVCGGMPGMYVIVVKEV